MHYNLAMSLVVVIAGPEGIVLASDQRTVLAARSGADRSEATFDSTSKLYTLRSISLPCVIAACGKTSIANTSIWNLLPEFESTIKANLSIRDIALSLQSFLSDAIPESSSDAKLFVSISGYDLDSPFGRTYFFEVPAVRPMGTATCSRDKTTMTFLGDSSVAERLLNGYDKKFLEVLRQRRSSSGEGTLVFEQNILDSLQYHVPLSVLSLEAKAEFARFLVETTVTMHKFSVFGRTCGGNVDVAILTKFEGVRNLRLR